MKIVLLLSGHIRTLKGISKHFDTFFGLNSIHKFHIVYSTSKHNYQQISDEKVNHKHFNRYNEGIIDTSYIVSTFPFIDQTVIFDDTSEYKALYEKLMYQAKDNFEKIVKNPITNSDNKRMGSIFLETFDIEIKSTYHTHSFHARAVDEICHIINGIQFIKNNIDCDIIIVSRPDIILHNFRINDIFLETNDINNIYTCETDYYGNPFVCPGLFFGAPTLMYDVFNDNFSFGNNPGFIICAESQIGYNIMKKIDETKRMFFDFGCCMIGDYRSIDKPADNLIKSISKGITDISDIDIKLNAYNLRYYLCITSSHISCHEKWLRQKRYFDIIAESEFIFSICDIHTINPEYIQPYINYVKGIDPSHIYFKKYYKNTDLNSIVTNNNKYINIFIDDYTSDVSKLINDIIKISDQTQINIMDGFVDCLRPKYESDKYLLEHPNSNNIVGWYCKNIRKNTISPKIRSLPMFYHDKIKKVIIDTFEHYLHYRKPMHFMLCVCIMMNQKSQFVCDIQPRLDIIDKIKFMDFCDYITDDLDIIQELNLLLQYKFCIIPVTVNRDSFLFWICITMGTIPIIINSHMNNISPKLYDNLPVLIVESINDLNEEMLNDFYDANRNNEFNYNIMTNHYWSDLL